MVPWLRRGAGAPRPGGAGWPEGGCGQWETRKYAAPLPPGRCVHRHALPGQPGRRRARRRRADHRRHAAVRQLDQPVGDHVRAPAVQCAGATTRSGSSPRAAELPFAGHPTLGTCHAWLEAGGKPARPRCSCRSAGPGWSRSARSPDGLAFAAPPLIRSGPVDEPLGRAHRRPARHRAGPTSSTSPGPTTGRAGSPCCCPAPRRCWRCGPGPSTWTSGVAGPYPPGSPEAVRGPRVLPQRRRHGRGPGDRQPERLAGAVAAATPAGPARPTWPARARRWAGRAGCTSPATATARSGSAAARSPACREYAEL